MKGYLINPEEHTVEEVQVDNTLASIYAHIEASTFDCVRLQHRDVIYVDDEGLFRKNHYFMVHGCRSPIAGRGLVLGTDQEGNSVDPVQSLAEITGLVRFMTYEAVLELAEQLDAEGREQETRANVSGSTGFIYVPIAGILKDAAYTKSSK